ncbi:hypothetical protein BCR32DRAFT_288426, partial [Anaeromyces robustus]
PENAISWADRSRRHYDTYFLTFINNNFANFGLKQWIKLRSEQCQIYLSNVANDKINKTKTTITITRTITTTKKTTNNTKTDTKKISTTSRKIIPTSTVSSRCGPEYGACAKSGYCCNKLGYCGKTDKHCGTGCQPAYELNIPSLSDKCALAQVRYFNMWKNTSTALSQSYNFENSRNYLKLNLEFLKYSKDFRWILRARFIKELTIGLLIVSYLKKFRINHFSDLDKNFFYFLDNLFNCLYVTSDNSSVDNRINNIVKGYKSSFNNGNNSIRKCLYKCQTESVGQSSRENADPITDPRWSFIHRIPEGNKHCKFGCYDITILICSISCELWFTLFFLKFDLTIEDKSLEIYMDLDEDYEDNIYYMMLNAFLDGCYAFEKLKIDVEWRQWHELIKSSSESPVSAIVGLSYLLLLPIYNNNKNTPGGFKGIDAKKIRHGIYSETDSNDTSFVE